MRIILPPEMNQYEIHEGLCSECMPVNAKFDNGHLIGFSGKWHNKFPKVHIDDFMKSNEGKYYERRGNQLIYKGN